MNEFRKLAEGVYAFLQPPLVWYSNSGVIIGKDDVIIIDSLTNKSMADNLLVQTKRVTNSPVTLLINTHAHADHIYTNHLFPSALVVSSQTGREKTREFLEVQRSHDEAFRTLFHGTDFTGGHYTLQDLTFSGRLSLYHHGKEIWVIDLGAGHSESDVIVHLPDEEIVFCGDVFMNGLPPMPLEGHLSGLIGNLRKLEELDARIYLPGHGEPASLKEVKEQRFLLESLAARAHDCFERGLTYDEAMESFADGPVPVEYARPVVLSGYCELAGRRPESKDPSNTGHLQVLRGIAEKAIGITGAGN